MIIDSRVVRRSSSTLVIFGPSDDDAYKLSPADVLRIEQSTDQALEFLTEDELVAAIETLAVKPLPLDDEDRVLVAAADLPVAPQVTAATGAAVAATVDQPVSPPPPPPTASVGDPEPPEEPSGSNRTLLIVGILAVAAVIVLLIVALAGGLGGDDTTGQATPTPSATVEIPTAAPGTPEATATVNTTVLSGPGSQYNIIGVLLAGQSAPVVGRSADAQWWVIDFPATPQGQGWVPDSTVLTENVTDVPIVAPPPVPTATPAPPIAITDWLGEYYDNRNLQGEPAVTRNDATINFDWGTNPPAPGMPTENWSARWTISRDVPAGTYRFTVWVDDGVRVYVDDNLVIDGWMEGALRSYEADVNVTQGTHTVRVEYFQAAGTALIQVGIGYVNEYPDWKGEYFDNPDVSGEPTVVRNDVAIDFNWAGNPPVPGLPANNYSVRWTRQAAFEQDNYVFQASVEGGTRLWFDGRLLIDSWENGGFRTLQAESGPVSQGNHDLRVEYFKLSGNGRITVNWAPKGPDQPPAAVIEGPTQAQVGQQVVFSARNSQAAQGSSIVAYEWDFGDGTGSNDMDATKAYDQPGVYTVQLTVTDDQDLSGTSSQEISVSEAPQPPTASILGPTQAPAGQPVTFDGSGSSGSSPIVAYRWTFGDGGTADGQRVEYVFDQSGVYSVNLVVTDQQGLEGSADTSITILESDTPESPIVGIPWSLVAYADAQGNSVSLLPGTEITALFAADGTLSGLAGCNTYNATYVLDGASIAITAPIATSGACTEPAGIMEQESAYLALLPLARQAQVVDGNLALLDANGQDLLTFGAP